jgi:hypothetical protein
LAELRDYDGFPHMERAGVISGDGSGALRDQHLGGVGYIRGTLGNNPGAGDRIDARVALGDYEWCG